MIGNSDFYEISVSPKNEKRQKVYYIIFKIVKIFFAILAALEGVFAFTFYNPLWIPCALTVLMAVAAYYAQRTFYCFYDYTYVGGSVRVTKVINNIKRKPLASFDVKNIIEAGNIDSDFFIKNYKNKAVKKIYATNADITEKDPVFRITENGVEKILLIKFDEKFLTFVMRSAGVSKFDKEYLKLIVNG